MTTPQPLLVAAAIRPMRGRRVFGKRSKTLRHLWLTPDHERSDPRYATFVATAALCGWEQRRTTREEQGLVTSAAAVLREVEAEMEREPYAAVGAVLGATVAKSDACKALGYCVLCVGHLSPRCGHEDCREHANLALACFVSGRASGEAARR